MKKHMISTDMKNFDLIYIYMHYLIKRRNVVHMIATVEINGKRRERVKRRYVYKNAINTNIIAVY